MIDGKVDVGKTVDEVVAAVKATLDDVLSKRDEVRPSCCTPWQGGN